MKKIGIITYHAAYNYGSVLQAYALQQELIKLGYKVEIINYRMDEQKKYYALYRTSYGLKIFLKDLQQFPIHLKRKKRVEKFEEFIASKLILTKEFANPKDIMLIAKRYDCLVSGSDQIWNKHSNELWNADWEYMKPYFFSGCNGYKVSYASSIGNMTDEELKKVEYDVKKFAYVSLREQSAANKVRELFSIDVDIVPDPTFLLCKEEWERFIINVPKRKDKFFFFYSLNGIKMIKKWKSCIEALCDEMGYRAVVVTPYIYVKYMNRNIENHPEYGPYDFLACIRDCDFVLTDSYHGTALALNMGKKVYSIITEASTEYRKSDLLKALGQYGKIVKDPKDVYSKLNKKGGENERDLISLYREEGEKKLQKIVKNS